MPVTRKSSLKDRKRALLRQADTAAQSKTAISGRKRRHQPAEVTLADVSFLTESQETQGKA